MKVFDYEEYVCKLGESALENWQLLDEAQDHHLFFHLSAFPSGYVILEYNETYPYAMLVLAAQICKEGAKYRNIRNIKVDYCRCDNLRKGEKTGVVYFKSQKKVKQIKI